MADAEFNDIIHASVRLRICGLLSTVDQLDFTVLRETLNVSDATLSKHLRTLAEAGFVKSTKAASPERADARRITWLSLTIAGSAAFDAHVRALRAITHTDK